MDLTIRQAMELALAHHGTGRLDQAEDLYRRVLAVEPDNSDAMEMLGVVASQRGRHEEGLKLIDQALALRPDAADYHANRGIVLIALGKTEEAIQSFQRALKLQPDFPSAEDHLANALMNMGIALRESGRLEEAIEAYRQCLDLKPNFAEAHSNLAVALSAAGKTDEAIAEYRRAIELKPDLPQAHHNLSLLLLMRGDWEEGWKEFEWRWRCKDFPSRRRDFPEPMWKGEALNGKTILIHAEQGIGDTIQFIRYVPEIVERGGKIVLECQRPVLRLMNGFPGAQQVVAAGESLPRFDVHCPMMSLPLALGTRVETIPHDVPYLSATAELKKQWVEKLGPRDGNLRVALNWSGNPGFQRDRTRSMSLSQLAALAGVPAVTFFSLQKGPPASQIHQAPTGLRIVDVGRDLEDFADTAAVISLVDLVITTDTSIPHLGGALGARVWLMLQFAADWRWMVGREDSPWYPTIRLFRQSARGDWSGVVERVAAELEIFRARRGG
jgi:Flp pilus assembly protein TadD